MNGKMKFRLIFTLTKKVDIMKKYAMQAIFLIVCILSTSCELFHVRDDSTENLDTLSLYLQLPDDVSVTDQHLSVVRKYLRKRPSEVNLWNTEPLRSNLYQILGSEYEPFVELMQNATPLKEEKLIYTIGSHPDLSRIGFGYMIIDAEKNLLRVGIVKPGYHRTFGAGTNDLNTPDEIERKFKSML